MPSLQEQLLNAGVVDQKKAKSIAKEQRKQKKKTPKGQSQISESAANALAARKEKADRDRELSRQQNEKAELKAIAAQIKQLIEVNKIDRRGGELPFQFSDGKKIKKIYVTELLASQIGKGIISIVKLGDKYELVPYPVANKIAQRDESRIIPINTSSAVETEEDDPYADYQIPDDLMW